MKKTFISTLIAICLLTGAKTVNAQAFDIGTQHLNIGIGLGGYYNYGYLSGSDYSSIPTIFLSYDQGLIADVGPGIIGIGGFLGFSSAHANYGYVGYEWDYKWSNIVIGARGTYHFPLNNDKLDFYGGLGLGLWIQKYTYTNSDPFWNGTLNTDATSTNLYYAFSVGGKYMFTDKLGAFAELGYDIAYLKLGVTLALGAGGSNE